MLRVILVALLLCACAGPTGPIVGDWRGAEPSISYFYQRSTELVLDGPPGANSGTYHFNSRVNAPLLVDRDDQFTNWVDHWEKRMLRTAEGRSYLTLHLRNAPGSTNPDYIWTTNNLLIPLINPLHPDLGRQALRVALYPVPRTAYGYGRL